MEPGVPFYHPTLSLLYRLCISPHARQILEVNDAGVPVLCGDDWDGSTVTRWSGRGVEAAADLPFAPSTFDAVVVHRALAPSFVPRLAKLLKAGGTLAGCGENRLHVTGIVGWRRRAGRMACSTRGCRAAMTAAGLRDINVFGVFPDADAPRKLLSVEAGWSRRASRRHLEGLRPLLSRRGYLVWRLLAEVGVAQHLGRAIFYYGRRPC